MLEKACQVFLKKSTAQIQEVCKETLEGHQRAIMGETIASCNNNGKEKKLLNYYIYTTSKHIELECPDHPDF